MTTGARQTLAIDHHTHLCGAEHSLRLHHHPRVVKQVKFTCSPWLRKADSLADPAGRKTASMYKPMMKCMSAYPFLP